MELGIDFKFRDDMFNSREAGSTVPVELIIEPFTGVVYRYTTVTFKMGEDNVPRLLYDYEILKTNDLSMTTLRKNDKFNTALGLILNTLLIDSSEAEIVSETRTNDTKEPDQGQELHSQGSTVS